MLNSRSLAEYSSHLLSTTSNSELDQRLGLYRVFLKLYEHHRALLDEILDLENSSQSPMRIAVQYVQGVIQDQQVCLITNLLQSHTQALWQPQSIWIIGRDRAAALPIQDSRLSRRHAAIHYVQNQGFFLIDLNSTNGSFVNGEPVRSCTALSDGDQVRLGSLSFTFFVCQQSQAMPEVDSDVLKQIQIAQQGVSPPQVSPPSSPSPAVTAIMDDEDDATVEAKSTFLFLKKSPSAMN